jgi:hypothetical protein
MIAKGTILCVHCLDKAIVLRNGEPVCMSHATEPSNPYRGGMFSGSMLTIERLELIQKVLKTIDPWPELAAARAVFCNPAIEYRLRELLKLDPPVYLTECIRPTAVGVWCPTEFVYLPRNRQEIEMLETKAYYDENPMKQHRIPHYHIGVFVKRLHEYKGAPSNPIGANGGEVGAIDT